MATVTIDESNLVPRISMALNAHRRQRERLAEEKESLSSEFDSLQAVYALLQSDSKTMVVSAFRPKCPVR